jgi:hypothetical protein
MTDLRVQTDRVRAAAADGQAVADQVHKILSTLRAEASSYYGKWGDDQYGQSFADGSGGYIAASSAVESGILSIADALHVRAVALADGAVALDGTDTDSARGFSR